MFKKTRHDATLIRNLPAFTRLMPFLMPDKKGSLINYEQDVDVTETLALLKKINRELIKEREIATLFSVVIAATVRAIALRPKLNRFISGKRYWQRNQILINFVAKKVISDEGKEVNVKIAFKPDETLAGVARTVNHAIREATAETGDENEKVVDILNHLPDFLLRAAVRFMNFLDRHNLAPRFLTDTDPMWSSVFLTNVGSFGLDAPFHHLFERGNCPVFLAMGIVRDELRPNAEGQPVLRKMLRLRYSFDDRICDGVYVGKGLRMLQDFVERADQLLVPPELTPALRSELNLREST